ncbi:hypothetical protein [Streptomyces sp. NPDC101150]|uniref:hypothetical protein n=1 Tax=Streptomyces sp. NPDC101150 TaxID=3366114 RepID=UPI0038071EA6
MSRSVALGKALSRAASNTADPSWPDRLASDLRRLDANWRESAEVCADAAWAARSAGNSVLARLQPAQLTIPDLVLARTYQHLYLNALRYDFRCPTLQSLIEQLQEGTRRPLDCYSRALYAFALLGQSRPQGLDLLDHLLEEADAHAKTLHVLLHGLWFGQHLQDRAARILALSSRPPFDEGKDPIVLFRTAGALRGLGRYDEALTAIDRAFDLLPPGDAPVHADLVRERLLTTTARDLATLHGWQSPGHGSTGPLDTGLSTEL